MEFYNLLQLDPSILKKQIRAADTKKEKHRLVWAMAVRSVLTVLFAIALISPVAGLFGPENSPMAVALFCILLGTRFVDFGYCILDSMVNLAVVFALLVFAPSAAACVNPLLAALIHVAAFFVILFMTSNRPEMGNAGIYTFAYIYLSGNPVAGSLLMKRALLGLVGYVICGAIFLGKHHKKNKDDKFMTLVTGFSLKDRKTQWQLQLAMGVGLLLALGSFFQLKRMMWAAFACGSVLGCYCPAEGEIKQRFIQRMVGTLAGTLIFFLCYSLLPDAVKPVLSIAGGLCLGFCTDYRFKTACNAMGALMMATGIYGLNTSVVLRVGNNLLGVVFGALFLLAFQWVSRNISSRRKENAPA